jgi:hypothetical protein
MKRTGKYLLILSAVILAASSLLIIELNHAQTGVVQREKFSFAIRYNFLNHGLEMNTIFSSLDISDIMKNNNTVVQYEIGSVNQASYLFNITDENGVTYNVNTLTYGNIVFYQSNLNKNDKLYSGTNIGDHSSATDGSNFANIIVNDSQTISYPSGQRTINHSNYTLGTGYFNTQVNSTIYEDIYFDKSTGVATHVERVEVFTDNHNPSQYSILDSTWDLNQSSAWTVGTSTQNSHPTS